MLIEIHILQNHSPSNLNRDDTGSPKECVFGGVRRGRISSQCLKRTVRRSDIFQTTLAGHLGTRTRQLPELVREAFAKDPALAPLAELAAKKTSGFGTKEGTERPVDKSGKYLTAQTMFLADSDIQAVIDVVRGEAAGKSAKDFEKVKTKDLQAAAVSNGFRPISVDVALFGRMVTNESIRDVEASCQVAHALSTHRVEAEFDYFTAVDDLQGKDESEREEDSGADMIGDVEYNSACYYKYFSVDLRALVDNMAGRGIHKEVHAEEERQAGEIARKAVLAMLEAAVMVTPSGKQNTFASHTLPAAVLVEVRPVRTPISYANAFVKPVHHTESPEGLVQASLERFGTHIEKITQAFGLRSDRRLWFAPEHLVNVSGTEKVDTLPDLYKKLEEAMGG
ncbi:MAG: type I-E CRISPR-associated protein Cas7/Cse4/CasC [Meiothermus sp.]|nr:type I-E CRISPR-associated protein Cas7/Cse4/CasC [Meiothermus sp.]